MNSLSSWTQVAIDKFHAGAMGEWFCRWALTWTDTEPILVIEHSHVLLIHLIHACCSQIHLWVRLVLQARTATTWRVQPFSGGAALRFAKVLGRFNCCAATVLLGGLLALHCDEGVRTFVATYDSSFTGSRLCLVGPCHRHHVIYSLESDAPLISSLFIFQLLSIHLYLSWLCFENIWII